MNFKTSILSLLMAFSTIPTCLAGGGDRFADGDSYVAAQTIHFTNTASVEEENKQFVLRYVMNWNGVKRVHTHKQILSQKSSGAFKFPKGSFERSISVQTESGKWYSAYIFPQGQIDFTPYDIIINGRVEENLTLMNFTDGDLYHRQHSDEDYEGYISSHFARSQIQ